MIPKSIKLRDCIVQLNTGLNPRDNFSLGEGSIKYITAKNLNKAGYIDFSSCDYIDEQAKEIIHRRSDIQLGDILFASRAPIGHCHLITEDPSFYDVGESIFCIRVNKEIIVPEYLCLYLSSDLFIKMASKRVTGSVIQEIRISDLLDTDVVLPDKHVQTKIAKCIGYIDKKIELNKSICSDLESMAKLLYDYWFVQLDFPDENGKPYKSSGGKMVWNEELKREIPDGWEVKPLSAVFDITMGSSPSGASLNENGDGIEFYQGSTDFGNIYPTKRVYTTAPVRFSKAQDVLLSVRAPVGTMNIAMNDCCIGRGLAAIHHFSTMFAWNTMLTFSAYFDIFNNNGTTFGALTSDDLKGQLSAVPPENLINKYHGTTIAIEKQIRNLSKENQQLASLRDFLLPMLMNGQVKIKE